MLIDSGEKNGIVMAYLDSLGIKTINVLVISHPHLDHLGGMPGIIDRYDIEQVVMPRVTETTTLAYLKLLEAVKAKGLRITEGKAGLVLDLGPSVMVECLAPNGDRYTDDNDYSVVVKLIHEDVSFLLTGDASADTEREMLEYHKQKLKSTVLKVGHHGSSTATTSAFFEAVAPKMTVISCGAENSFGHPSWEVIERIKNTAMYRTDRHGTIIVTSDGKRIAAKSHSSGGASTALTVRRTPDLPVTNAQRQSAVTARHPQAAMADTVYVTKTGSKYHRAGCRYLTRSSISIPKTEAVQKYRPCTVCKP